MIRNDKSQDLAIEMEFNSRIIPSHDSSHTTLFQSETQDRIL